MKLISCFKWPTYSGSPESRFLLLVDDKIDIAGRLRWNIFVGLMDTGEFWLQKAFYPDDPTDVDFKHIVGPKNWFVI